MAEKLCNLAKIGGGMKPQELVNIASTTAISIPASTNTAIPNSSFTLTKGTWIIYIFSYIGFGTNNNVWFRIGPTDTSFLDVNPQRIASGKSMTFAATPILTFQSDTLCNIRLESVGTAQTYTPYSIKVIGIKLP